MKVFSLFGGLVQRFLVILYSFPRGHMVTSEDVFELSQLAEVVLPAPRGKGQGLAKHLSMCRTALTHIKGLSSPKCQ